MLTKFAATLKGSVTKFRLPRRTISTCSMALIRRMYRSDKLVVFGLPKPGMREYLKMSLCKRDPNLMFQKFDIKGLSLGSQNENSNKNEAANRVLSKLSELDSEQSYVPCDVTAKHKGF